MRENCGANGHLSAASACSSDSSDSDDSVCQCDSASSHSNCKIDKALQRCCKGSSHENICGNAGSKFGTEIGRRLGKDSIEKVNPSYERRISSGGSWTRKSRKDECARDKKVKSSWAGIDGRREVKNSVQEYHCTKKDGASTYTCVIVKKVDLQKQQSSDSSSSSSGDSDYCSYNMKGRESAPAGRTDANPSSGAPAHQMKRPWKESDANDASRKDICSQLSVPSASSQHSNVTREACVTREPASKSQVCSGKSSKGSIESEKSWEKSEVDQKRSYLSWVSNALKNSCTIASCEPVKAQNSRTSMSGCESDSATSICIAEKKVEEKGSQTELSKCEPELKKKPESDFCSKSKDEPSEMNVCGSKSSLQTGFASYFSGASSKTRASTDNSKAETPSKTCLKKKPSSGSFNLKLEKKKKKSDSVEAKSSRISFCEKTTKRSIANKASQTDVTKCSKEKNDCKKNGSRKSLCSQGSNLSGKSSISNKCRNKKKDKCKGKGKSSDCIKKEEKGSSWRKRQAEGEMNQPCCSLSCKESFMATKNDPCAEIARTSCSIKSCDANSNSKADEETSESHEECLCGDPSCDITIRPSSCRRKKGLFKRLFGSKTAEERCLKRERQKEKRREKERKRREKERERERKAREKARERERKDREKEEKRERKDREKECKRRRKEREKERKQREKDAEKERKCREKERKKREKMREKERKQREKERKKEEKRKATEAAESKSDSESSVAC